MRKVGNALRGKKKKTLEEGPVDGDHATSDSAHAQSDGLAQNSSSLSVTSAISSSQRAQSATAANTPAGVRKSKSLRVADESKVSAEEPHSRKVSFLKKFGRSQRSHLERQRTESELIKFSARLSLERDNKSLNGLSDDELSGASEATEGQRPGSLKDNSTEQHLSRRSQSFALDETPRQCIQSDESLGRILSDQLSTDPNVSMGETQSAVSSQRVCQSAFRAPPYLISRELENNLDGSEDEAQQPTASELVDRVRELAEGERRRIKNAIGCFLIYSLITFCRVSFLRSLPILFLPPFPSSDRHPVVVLLNFVWFVLHLIVILAFDLGLPCFGLYQLFTYSGPHEAHRLLQNQMIIMHQDSPSLSHNLASTPSLPFNMSANSLTRPTLWVEHSPFRSRNDADTLFFTREGRHRVNPEATVGDYLDYIENLEDPRLKPRLPTRLWPTGTVYVRTTLSLMDKQKVKAQLLSLCPNPYDVPFLELPAEIRAKLPMLFGRPLPINFYYHLQGARSSPALGDSTRKADTSGPPPVDRSRNLKSTGVKNRSSPLVTETAMEVASPLIVQQSTESSRSMESELTEGSAMSDQKASTTAENCGSSVQVSKSSVTSGVSTGWATQNSESQGTVEASEAHVGGLPHDDEKRRERMKGNERRGPGGWELADERDGGMRSDSRTLDGCGQKLDSYGDGTAEAGGGLGRPMSGPSGTSAPCLLNATIDFESEVFCGRMLLRAVGFHEAGTPLGEYFRARKRVMMFRVQGCFKKILPAREVLCGQMFYHPLKLPSPILVKMVMSLMRAFNQIQIEDITSRKRPYLITPLLTSMQTINIRDLTRVRMKPRPARIVQPSSGTEQPPHSREVDCQHSEPDLTHQGPESREYPSSHYLPPGSSLLEDLPPSHNHTRLLTPKCPGLQQPTSSPPSPLTSASPDRHGLLEAAHHLIDSPASAPPILKAPVKPLESEKSSKKSHKADKKGKSADAASKPPKGKTMKLVKRLSSKKETLVAYPTAGGSTRPNTAGEDHDCQSFPAPQLPTSIISISHTPAQGTPPPAFRAIGQLIKTPSDEREPNSEHGHTVAGDLREDEFPKDELKLTSCETHPAYLRVSDSSEGDFSPAKAPKNDNQLEALAMPRPTEVCESVRVEGSESSVVGERDRSASVVYPTEAGVLPSAGVVSGGRPLLGPQWIREYMRSADCYPNIESNENIEEDCELLSEDLRGKGAAQRKKYFSNIKNFNNKFFYPDFLYTFEGYQHQFRLDSFALDMGFKQLEVASFLNGQPIELNCFHDKRISDQIFRSKSSNVIQPNTEPQSWLWRLQVFHKSMMD